MEIFLANFLGVLFFGKGFSFWEFFLCVGNCLAPRLTPRNRWGFYLPAREPRGGGGGSPPVFSI